MHAELASDLDLERLQHRSARARAISVLGPLTALAGTAWALIQPYRITLLHPHGQSFWWLAVEPPLLVVLVGLLFHILIAPGLLEDLDDAAPR